MIRLATAQIVRVVDGDTLHTLLDIGWGIILRPRGLHGAAGTVRAMHLDGTGYDAPESWTAKGKEARIFAQGLILPGQELEVASHGLDDFGRTLGSVRLADGRDWAAVMAAAGYVK